MKNIKRELAKYGRAIPKIIANKGLPIAAFPINTKLKIHECWKCGNHFPYVYARPSSGNWNDIEFYVHCGTHCIDGARATNLRYAVYFWNRPRKHRY